MVVIVSAVTVSPVRSLLLVYPPLRAGKTSCTFASLSCGPLPPQFDAFDQSVSAPPPPLHVYVAAATADAEQSDARAAMAPADIRRETGKRPDRTSVQLLRSPTRLRQASAPRCSLRVVVAALVAAPTGTSVGLPSTNPIPGDVSVSADGGVDPRHPARPAGTSPATTMPCGGVRVVAALVAAPTGTAVGLDSTNPIPEMSR